MQFRNKEITYSSKVMTFESIVVDVENGRCKSIKRSLQECGRGNVIDVYIVDKRSFC